MCRKRPSDLQPALVAVGELAGAERSPVRQADPCQLGAGLGECLMLVTTGRREPKEAAQVGLLTTWAPTRAFSSTDSRSNNLEC